MTPPIEGKPAHQFAMLGQRRFGPFFLAQFLSSGNDNLLKFSLTLLVSMGWPVGGLGMPLSLSGPLIGLLFLVPFVLCSVVIGPWVDRQDKAWLIRRLKGAELLLMALAAYGFWQAQAWALLGSVFGMGLYSACLGPAKFAYLPQVLRARELMGANGLVMAGQFAAMLLGHVVGLALLEQGTRGAMWIALVGVSASVLGWLVSLAMPAVPSPVADQAGAGNPLAELALSLEAARRDSTVFQALVGLGWMWFIGAFYLFQFPVLARDVLGGAPEVGVLLLAVFAGGLLVATLFCEIMSRRNVEIGLVLIGAMGMGSFGGDLYFSTHAWRLVAGAPALTVPEFWAHEGSGRLLYDLFRLSLGLGLFGMPLYAFIQWRAQPGQCARLMALGNVFSAVFLSAGCLVAGALLWMGLSLPHLFLAGAVLNTGAVIFFFAAMPEGLVRLAVMGVTRFFYLVRLRGEAQWPMQGAALMVCNHVTVIDVMFVAMLGPRQVLMLVDPAVLKTKGLGWFYRRIPAVPLFSAASNPVAHAHAIECARQALDRGQLVCVFPEGAITPDGHLHPFMDVVPAIVEQRDVPVIPAALQNMWGSSFSRIAGEPMRKPFRRGIYNRIGFLLGPALTAEEATTERLQAEVARLLAEPRP